jgi:hypothetical protein
MPKAITDDDVEVLFWDMKSHLLNFFRQQLSKEHPIKSRKYDTYGAILFEFTTKF